MSRQQNHSTDRLSRRDFSRLTGAALGGLVAGTMLGCGNREDHAQPIRTDLDENGEEEAEPDPDEVARTTHDPQYLLEGKNVCRGLNHSCANHRGGDNACAGQGTCHTAAEHSCHGENECKGEGGCEQYPGQNHCRGQGKCGVPLAPETWERARTAFERAMTQAGREFGPAPDPS